MRAGRTFALALALAAVLAGCGTGTQGDAGRAGKGGVTLTLMAISDNRPAWNELIAAYKKAAPRVTIRASFAPTDQLQTSVRAQLGAGNAPDLFVNWPGNGSAMAVQQLAPAGLVADLSDQRWIARVPVGMKPMLGIGGKIYMWSAGVTPIGVIYNRQVFKDAGIAAPPKTWSELLADGEKIKAIGKIPFAVGNQTPWITQLIPYAIAPSTAFAENPNLARDMLAGKKTFSDSGWRTVFERYLELYDKGLFNDSPNGTTFEQSQQLVGSGDAAMVVQVTATLPSFLAAAKHKADIGTFPFPGTDRADQLRIPAGVSAGIGASATSKRLPEAKRFIEWLGRPENMAAFSKATYSVPLVDANLATLDPLVEPFVPFLTDNRTIAFMDQQWPNAKVQPTHFAGLQDLIAGKTTVPGLLRKLDEAYAQK